MVGCGSHPYVFSFKEAKGGTKERKAIEMKKAVITVLGKDRVGITLKVCEVLAGANINILDISQTIVSGYFNMVMVTDITDANMAFEDISAKLAAVGEALGLEIKIQHTAIFDAMHRI